MPRLIVFPKSSEPIRNLVKGGRPASKAMRLELVTKLDDENRSSTVAREVGRWLRQRNSERVQPSAILSVQGAVARATDHDKISYAYYSVANSFVINQSDQFADLMRRELREVSVIRDQPITLIAPLASANPTPRVTPPSLWHKQAIGLPTPQLRGHRGAGAVVAVLDTGVDGGHAELDGRILGQVEWDEHGGAWEQRDPMRDTDIHGTHVAGLICGRKSGIAPAALVRSVLMLPNGYGSISQFVTALEWVSRQPDVDIVNISAGIRGLVAGMESLIDNLLDLDILPVVAAGNDGRNSSCSPGNYARSLTVGAMTAGSTVWPLSSSAQILQDGIIHSVPDVLAPGHEIWSCVPGDHFQALSGTSMATPIVSGLACLIRGRYPTMGVHEVIERILASCYRLDGVVERQGYGVINSRAAF